MKFNILALLLSLISAVYCQRVIHLSSHSNTILFDIDQSNTTIQFEKTLGDANTPVLLFKYDKIKDLNLPNFDYLVSNSKLNEYYLIDEGFSIPNDIEDVYQDTLIEEISFKIVNPGTYIIYTPPVKPFEYKVSINEAGFFGKFDQIVFCLVNIFYNFLIHRLFKGNTKMYSMTRNIILCKVALFSISFILLFFNFQIFKYTEILNGSAEDLFTILFLMGYGTTMEKIPKSSYFSILFIIFPNFLNRFLDLKEDYKHLITINNSHYNIICGILGNEKFDGMQWLDRMKKEKKIGQFAPIIAALFGLSKSFKCYIFIKYMRRTMREMSENGPKTRFKVSVFLWLFSWSFIVAGLSPTPSNYSSFINIKDYSGIAKDVLLKSLRNKYILYYLDEFHWFIFWLIWYNYKDGKIDKIE
ncbi:unnamed protein product [Candida verbasci]|uniref:Uncharacterized protein n=1 Tax=Candida verbasci TaxID=1227364 RepID=A0A9W4TW62_9ASCO|nr:unnamed protein product [Candida verbasci]